MAHVSGCTPRGEPPSLTPAAGYAPRTLAGGDCVVRSCPPRSPDDVKRALPEAAVADRAPLTRRASMAGEVRRKISRTTWSGIVGDAVH